MSTLRYSGGEALAGSNIREGLEGASDQLVREGHPTITVVSGDRAYQTQVDIFLSRYVLAGQVNGRYVYDWRTWEGRIYGRISSAGTVAAPSRNAPHVAQIAADLGAPYNAYTAARARLVAIAPQYGIENTGTSFGEIWHWQTTRGVGRIGAPASFESTPFNPSEEDEMPINIRDTDTKISYTLIPGIALAAHLNPFGARLTTMIQNGGKWPSEAFPDSERAATGEIQLPHEQVLWAIAQYGFLSIAQGGRPLPAPGQQVKSDFLS